MSEELVKILGDLAVVVSPLLGALIGWIAVKVKKLIDSKIENETLRLIASKFNSALWSVVKEAEQTVVKEFKAKSADGKLTKADGDAIAAAVVAKLKSYLSLDELIKLFGSAEAVDKAIKSHVEAAVNDLGSAAKAREAALLTKKS